MNLSLKISIKGEIYSAIRYFTAKGEDTTAIRWNITEVRGNVMSIEVICDGIGTISMVKLEMGWSFMK